MQDNFKYHNKKNVIKIGYHGNKLHLENMHPRVTDALIKLSENYKIEFLAIYNIDNLGIWECDFPKNLSVQHIQWTESVYNDILSTVDIGIVPALLITKEDNQC